MDQPNCIVTEINGRPVLQFDEVQRQLILLALASLALLRPGWDYALGMVADKLDGHEMYQEFMRLNADQVKPL